MKKTKKLLSIILVILLVTLQFCPLLNVKAITLKGENSEGIREDLIIDTANLIVYNVSSGDTLMAYKVLDTFYNSATNEITYEFTNEFNTFLNTDSIKAEYPNFSIEDYIGLTSDKENGSASTSVITASTLNILVSKYATYIRTNNVTGIEMTTTDDTASANVVAGSYLILPKTVTPAEPYINDWNDLIYYSRSLYGVMVGNVVYTIGSTGWVLNDCSIVSKIAWSDYASYLATISISEYFDIVNNGNVEDLGNPFIQNLNTVLQKKHMYVAEMNLSEFPTNAINKVVGAEIEFPEGVTYDANNIYVAGETLTLIEDGKIVDESGIELGTLTLNGQHVSIELNTSITESYNSSIPIVFDVELNNNAVVGDLGNEITSTVTLTDDPYVEGSTTSIPTSAIMTTYGLELTSYGEKDTDGNAPLLKGATYEVYTDSQLTEQSKLGEFTVGEDGTGRFTGVPAGVVYLKQTKAPTGYQLITDTIEVHIADESSTDTNNDSYYEVSTYNKAMWYLPLTGGKGTIIYTMIGLIVIILSSLAIIKYKKNLNLNKN